jgi:hypothetical protein
VTEQTAGKGRPTPKRSEAQRRRTGPVAPPPTSRREAAKQLRAKQAEARQQQRRGSLRGEEAALLKRDQGPVRRHVRDVVDGRRSMAWVLLPVAVLVLLTSFSRNPTIKVVSFEVWLGACLAVAVEMVFTGFAISRSLRASFPDEPSWRGHVRYGVLRTLTMRRMRVPRPQVSP